MTPEYLIISADEAQTALRAHLSATTVGTCERHEDGACTYRWNDGARGTLRICFTDCGMTDLNVTHEGRETRTFAVRVDRYLTPEGVLSLVRAVLRADAFAPAADFERLLARSEDAQDGAH